MRKVTETELAIILFNATHTAATVIKDNGYKARAKQWFSNWFSAGTNLWREIKHETKDVPKAIAAYEELALYVYEVAKIALDKPDFQEFLNEIK